MGRGKQRGFSLMEMMMVIALLLICAAITSMSVVPVRNAEHVTAAYNTTLTTLRRARDQAAADMRVYVVTFTAPGTITVAQSLSITTTCQVPALGPVLLTATLPSDVSFQVIAGIPTSPSSPPTTPDGFGTGANAIDFDQGHNPGGTTICFQPDGTAVDQAGNTNNGVVYMARNNDIYSSRAVTLWGSTGRLRGWRLYKSGASYAWQQQ
jgi:prepilin-type N-terminal cleavage/methylation domain-containing protein